MNLVDYLPAQIDQFFIIKYPNHCCNDYVCCSSLDRSVNGCSESLKNEGFFIINKILGEVSVPPHEGFGISVFYCCFFDLFLPAKNLRPALVPEINKLLGLFNRAVPVLGESIGRFSICNREIHNLGLFSLIGKLIFNQGDLPSLQILLINNNFPFIDCILNIAEHLGGGS